MEEVVWKIETFETKNGDKPVNDFVKKFQSQAQAKIVHTVNLLKEYGNRLGMPHSKYLGSGLYELRIRGKDELRIFYCFTGQKTICLLHGIRKQTRQTPIKELETASIRMRNLTKI